MLDKLNDKEINFTLLFVIVSAFYINFYKPLQMDELSTYFHCSEKSLGELINANNSGVNMLPSFYFYINWIIGCLSDLNIFTLRIIPLIFGILSIYLLKDILLYFVDSKIATFTIVTALSHCPIYLFSICEARPYSLYLFLTLLLIKYTLKQNTDVLSIRLIILNFLIPSTFYFGGIYCVFLCIFNIMYRIIDKKFFRKYTISCILGWALFFILCFPTFISQINNTHTLHFSGKNSILTVSLFSYYGMHVYFNISLFIILFFFVHKRKALLFKNNLIVFIPFILIPFIVFIFSKSFSYGLFQERYFIPSIIIVFLIYAIISSIIDVNKLKQKLVNCHYLFCFAVFSVLTYSHASSYKYENPEISLSAISEYSCPIVTQSRRISFHCNQKGFRNVYQLVSDQSYAKHMKGFSPMLNPIPLSDMYILINRLLMEYENVLYISTPWVNEDINKIKQWFLDNKIIFNEIQCEKSPQVDSIYILSK